MEWRGDALCPDPQVEAAERRRQGARPHRSSLDLKPFSRGVSRKMLLIPEVGSFVRVGPALLEHDTAAVAVATDLRSPPFFQPQCGLSPGRCKSEKDDEERSRGRISLGIKRLVAPCRR